ncbi:hypothetical protein [Frigidibacter sp. SD6-1]|uniref:hypothetical protein n=1 Tax=Frigidibacter sp. SD6-1 TaxID=3032581 RepID=UPI0024DFEB7C|nr:hypothetical protein [Frigidibacter sp. SD6-1]
MTAKPKIFDCFTFYNELDLLELRLNELWPVVDHFVIAEAALTFTGKPKPLYFQENRARFAPFLDRIIHIVVEDFPPTASSWEREIHQRDCVRRGLAAARPDDLLLLSDVDEIPRASAVGLLRGAPPRRGEVVCFSLDWHAYYINVRLREKWVRLGPRAIRMDSLATIDGLRGVYAPASSFARDTVRWLKACRRMRTLVRRRVLEDAGWHFSWLGGVEAVAAKGSSISEHSHVRKGDKTLDWARARIDGLLGDRLGYDLVEDRETLPAYVRQRPDLFDRYLLRSDQSRSKCAASSSAE